MALGALPLLMLLLIGMWVVLARGLLLWVVMQLLVLLLIIAVGGHVQVVSISSLCTSCTRIYDGRRLPGIVVI